MPRVALGLEYDGAAFAGWQWQDGQRNVQACVEQAVGKVAAAPVNLLCAGRTDAGVHALEQVVHFDAQAERSPRAWLMGVNANLPGDVRVLWAREVPPAFHARYSAIARFYRYVILNRPMKSALLRRQVTWCYYPLDEARMQAAADHLLAQGRQHGRHAALGVARAASVESSALHARPENGVELAADGVQVRREEERVVIELCANAFLHHMVRNIAGVLMEIGAGRREPGWTRELLALRDRKQGGVTAPSDGLYLGGVCYPDVFGLPKHPLFDQLPKDAARHPV